MWISPTSGDSADLRLFTLLWENCADCGRLGYSAQRLPYGYENCTGFQQDFLVRKSNRSDASGLENLRVPVAVFLLVVNRAVGLDDQLRGTAVEISYPAKYDHLTTELESHRLIFESFPQEFLCARRIVSHTLGEVFFVPARAGSHWP